MFCRKLADSFHEVAIFDCLRTQDVELLQLLDCGHLGFCFPQQDLKSTSLCSYEIIHIEIPCVILKSTGLAWSSIITNSTHYFVSTLAKNSSVQILYLYSILPKQTNQSQLDVDTLKDMVHFKSSLEHRKSKCCVSLMRAVLLLTCLKM